MPTNIKISLRPNPNGDWPQVDPTAYIDPSAQLIGNVHIGPEVFVGPNAIIRADEIDTHGCVHPVKIAARCNVQDGVIIHALGGTGVTIGPETSISHGCIIHGPCTIGKGCFVGFRTVLYDAMVADEVFVGTSAVIQGVKLAAKSLVPPAASVLNQEDLSKIVNTTTSTERQFMQRIIAANLTLLRGYSRSQTQAAQPADDPFQCPCG